MPVKTIVHAMGFNPIPHVSGGDADVNTKSGRFTGLALEITNLALNADKRSISCRVAFSISELKPDFTTLALEREILIPVPDNMQIVRVVNASDYRNEWTISGQHHQGLWLRSNQANSCLESARYSIDGRGRDDQGNASLHLVLSFDVETAS